MSRRILSLDEEEEEEELFAAANQQQARQTLGDLIAEEEEEEEEEADYESDLNESKEPSAAECTEESLEEQQHQQQQAAAAAAAAEEEAHKLAAAIPTRNIWDAARRGDLQYCTVYCEELSELEKQRQQQLEENKKKKHKLATNNPKAKQQQQAQQRPASNAHSLPADAGLDLLNTEGCTPLHVSVIFQQRAVLLKLLEAGANLLARDRESGWTALHHALYRGDFLTAHILLSKGSKVAMLDQLQRSAFDLVQAHVADCVEKRKSMARGSNSGQQLRYLTHNALTAGTSAFAALSTNDDIVSIAASTHHLAYSFGYQTHYTLGYSCDHYQHRAKLIEQLAEYDVQQIVALKQSVFALTRDGFVFSFGQGMSGKLGHEEKETLIEPKRIQVLHNISYIAATDEYTLCVTVKGKVLCWGHTIFLTQNHPPQVSVKPSHSTGANSRLQPGSQSPTTSNRRLQSGTRSPPPGASPPSSANAASSSSLFSAVSSTPPLRYSQLPRRIESLVSHVVRRVYPSSNRIVFVNEFDDLFFIGQSVEDPDRWEMNQPKRCAVTLKEDEFIKDVQNHEDFIVVLTSAGVMRIQRKWERKFNKIWLQNYKDQSNTSSSVQAQIQQQLSLSSASASSSSEKKVKTIRDLFPQIPLRQNVIKMSWTNDGSRGACVTEEGMLYCWKLPPAESSSNVSSVSYPRCIGYLVEGLAHVRAVDVSIASGHTCIITAAGFVYHWGPQSLGHVHPMEPTNQTNQASNTAFPTPSAASNQQILKPRRLFHLTQVSKIIASESYIIALVAVHQPAVLPCFPTMQPLYEKAKSGVTVIVPSLRMHCEYHLAQQITPLSVVAAYQWAYDTHSKDLLHYCTLYLLENLLFYLPTLLAVPQLACLQHLQQEYAEMYPMWYFQPQWKQPLLPQFYQSTINYDANAPAVSGSPQPATVSVSSVLPVESESFSFSHALAQLRLASQPRTAEQRVAEIKLKRRGISKKLQQIQVLELKKSKSRSVKLPLEEQEKIDSKPQLQEQLAKFDRELESMRAEGSVSAAQLLETIQANAELQLQQRHSPKEKNKRKVIAEQPAQTDSAPAATALPSANETPFAEILEAEPTSAAPTLSHSASSRVASELLERPVRALANHKTTSTPVETTPKKKPTPHPHPSHLAVPSTPATPTTPNVDIGSSQKLPLSWKVASSSQASPTPAGAASPTAPPAASSFLAIQAEEKQQEDARNAALKSKAASTKGVTPTKASPSLVPNAGRAMWGSPAAAPVSAHATPTRDFPSLGAAAASPSVNNKSGSAFRPQSASSSSSALSPAIATTIPSAAPTGFSLADFMPTLPKPKPQPVKTWNLPPPVATTEAHQSTQPTSNGKKGKKGPVAPAAAAVPSAGPTSLAAIQQSEELKCYGEFAGFKTKKELSELASQLSLTRSAWNTQHVMNPIQQQSTTLLEVQSAELEAQKAEALRKQKLIEKAEKRKAKRKAAKERDAAIAAVAAANASENQSLPSNNLDVTPVQAAAANKPHQHAAPHGNSQHQQQQQQQHGPRGGRGRGPRHHAPRPTHPAPATTVSQAILTTFLSLLTFCFIICLSSQLVESAVASSPSSLFPSSSSLNGHTRDRASQIDADLSLVFHDQGHGVFEPRSSSNSLDALDLNWVNWRMAGEMDEEKLADSIVKLMLLRCDEV